MLRGDAVAGHSDDIAVAKRKFAGLRCRGEENDSGPENELAYSR
jgi:hypothetical protein